MNPRLILVADDEPAILQSTRLLLEDAGFRVVATNEAGRVAQLAREERPDVLLQDVRMPGLDVAKLVEELRADATTRGIPVLLFSASMDLDEIAESVGAAGILEKPFQRDELIAAISSAPA